MSNLDNYYSHKFTEDGKNKQQEEAKAKEAYERKQNKMIEAIPEIIRAILAAAEVSHPECIRMAWCKNKHKPFLMEWFGLQSSKYNDHNYNPYDGTYELTEYYFGWRINGGQALLTNGKIVIYPYFGSCGYDGYAEIDAILREVGFHDGDVTGLYKDLLSMAQSFGVLESKLLSWRRNIS
jgi:hypothetical protein